MIINKITIGFVIQEFDTEKGQFVNQSFVAGDTVNYEDKHGETLSHNTLKQMGFGPLVQEPYLPFDMVQPKP